MSAPAPFRSTVRYLLALNAGVTRGRDRCFYADPSWGHDLVEHTVHFSRMTFLAPVTDRTPLPHERLLPDVFHRVVAYRGFGGRFRSFLYIPWFVMIFVRELRRADIVHTCIAGKPFPIGWLIVPLARLVGTRVAIIVESAFWRVNPGERPTIARRISARLWEALNRWCLRQADYAAYQHEADRRALPAPRARRSVIYQASWINKSMIVAPEMVAARLAAARERGWLNVLFASRMVPEKGTQVVAAACGLLRDAPIRLTMLGEGPERATLAAIAAQAGEGGQLAMAAVIAYGPAFLAFLGQFDVVIVPSLSDEQPRIVYDAYAQGIPIVASRTDGLVACVTDGETGLLVAPNDPAALAGALATLAADHDRLVTLSFGALARAPLCTHRGFHAARARDIDAVVRDNASPAWAVGAAR